MPSAVTHSPRPKSVPTPAPRKNLLTRCWSGRLQRNRLQGAGSSETTARFRAGWGGQRQPCLCPCPRAAPATGGAGGDLTCVGWFLPPARLHCSRELLPRVHRWLRDSVPRPGNRRMLPGNPPRWDGPLETAHCEPPAPPPYPSTRSPREHLELAEPHQHGTGLGAGTERPTEEPIAAIWAQAAAADVPGRGGKQGAGTGPQHWWLSAGLGPGQPVWGSGAAGAGPQHLVLPGHHYQPGSRAGAEHGLLLCSTSHCAAVTATHVHQ